jgi:hypothetical protein
MDKMSSASRLTQAAGAFLRSSALGRSVRFAAAIPAIFQAFLRHRLPQKSLLIFFRQTS